MFFDVLDCLLYVVEVLWGGRCGSRGLCCDGVFDLVEDGVLHFVVSSS